jgi:hypothetical protein
MKFQRTAFCICLVAAACLTPLTTPAQTEYQEYKGSSTKTVLFEVTGGQHVITFGLGPHDQARTYEFARNRLKVARDRVTIDGEVLFDREGLHLGSRVITLSDITDIHVREVDERTTITFYTREEHDRRVGRIRQGNILKPYGSIVVDQGEFVRGLVFSVTGNIDVYGEVTKDVVTLFGDVFVAENAAVRGDIVSLDGRAEVSRQASVYGDVYSGKDGAKRRRNWSNRRQSEFEVPINTYYNRVDGFCPSLALRYQDNDSVLPSVWAMAGYAFEPKRWRYELGFEQTVYRRMPLAIGGSGFRKLASGYDQLLTLQENNAFVLLFKEDYKDYYEAEGAEVFVKARPQQYLTLTAGCHWEDTRWLPAEKNLWAIFARHKKFRDNFDRVDPAYRQQAIAEIDATTNVTLFGRASFSTRDDEAPFARSAWQAAAEVEKSQPSFDSDFDYTRFEVKGRRFQSLNRRTMLIVGAAYGGSDNYLPMYRRYFLGGLSTLQGYKHKEYMGTRYWLVNTEYRVNFPGTELAAALRWEAGRIANGNSFMDEDEVKHSLGVSLYIGDDVRLTLAKRLDRSDNDNPIFYARFTHRI